MLVRDFMADDVLRLQLQPMQALYSCMPEFAMTEDYGAALQASGPAVSIVMAGQLLGCAGLSEIWSGRAAAWALLSKACGPVMVPVVRALQVALNRHEYRRIETYVLADWPPALRLARLMGFALEGRLLRFMPDARDALLMARIALPVSHETRSERQDF